MADEVPSQTPPEHRRIPQWLGLSVREWVLTSLGSLIVIFELINAEARGGTFHYEFLVLAGGCLGLAIAGWADRRS